MGEDNIFTLFLKGIFLLILLFMLLALVLPFITTVFQGEIIQTLTTLFIYTFFILMAGIIILIISRVFN